MLERLRALDVPIRVGIIGVGSMGRGLVRQISLTPGIECVALADLNVAQAIERLRAIGHPCREASSPADAVRALREGELPVFADGLQICELPEIDVVIEATSAVLEGGRHALAAIEHQKHLVLMNSEVDLIFGPALVRAAESRGVICTSCDGDQHGVIKRLLDEITLWGFEPVLAGNIKGFLDRSANPTTIVPEADKRKLDYRMCTSYTDGTKLCIEMALVANAFGLRTVVPGMLGPRASSVTEALDLFDLASIREDGGAVVDYVLGAEPGGGVFVVGASDDPYQRDMLEYYKMGSGPFYLFYRPYHLCHIEAMQSIAEAALERRPLLQPTRGFRTNVTAYAKTDLRAGDSLDGIGGYACYGLIENATGDGATDGLPICLAEDVALARDVAQGERILFDDIAELPGDRDDFKLYEGALQASLELGS
jgi:predicted homoserine dehydrogenase-like protein